MKILEKLGNILSTIFIFIDKFWYRIILTVIAISYIYFIHNKNVEGVLALTTILGLYLFITVFIYMYKHTFNDRYVYVSIRYSYESEENEIINGYTGEGTFVSWDSNSLAEGAKIQKQLLTELADKHDTLKVLEVKIERQNN